jgi:hypothetical protein
MHLLVLTRICIVLDVVCLLIELVRYVFDNSTVNISPLRNSWEDMACYSSECFLTFVYAGDNIHHEIEQFVSCINLQQPTDASHRLTCFIQWRSTAAVKDNIGRQIQTHLQFNSSISETVCNRTHVHIHFFV